MVFEWLLQSYVDIGCATLVYAVSNLIEIVNIQLHGHAVSLLEHSIVSVCVSRLRKAMWSSC